MGVLEQQLCAKRRLSKHLADHAGCIALSIRILKMPYRQAKFWRESELHCCFDGVAFCRNIDLILGMLSAPLPDTDVDCGKAERSAFDDPAAGIPDQHAGMLQETQINRVIEIHQHTRLVVAMSKIDGLLNQMASARVGIGVNQGDLRL